MTDQTKQTPVSITLDGTSIGYEWLDKAYGKPLKVTVSDEMWKRIDKSCANVREIIERGDTVYGLNTGFGSLCSERISDQQLEELQENLILSHAVGVGPDMPSELVRWLMLFKIHALGQGVSGVSRRPVESLTALLNADVLPVIPTQGSLGASGDLAPLAHMVLPILGRGKVLVDGKEVDASVGLQRAGIQPIKLGPKEGLALINGTQFMSSYGAALVVRAKRLLKHADVIAAASLDGYAGSVRPYHDGLHQVRPHAGAIETAENVRRLLEDSEINASHQQCSRVQDPYSLRCVPQVHGASRDAVRHIAAVIQTDVNAVTDNPVVLDKENVISGGNFHGQPLALVLDYLSIAMAELANISERRIYLLLSGHAGLPSLLMQDTGLNSGFMLPQYTAAALVSQNKQLATPSSVDSIPTSLGQEDHVSMGANGATKAWRVMENTETVLAIEQMCAAQALDFRKPMKSGKAIEAVHSAIRRKISYADHDRLFGEDIRRSLSLLRSQQVVEAAEEAVGDLH